MPRTINFCFFLVEDFSAENVDSVRRFVEGLAHRHAWAWGSPDFVDTTDDSSCTRPGDLPIRSLGGVVAIADTTEGPAANRQALQQVQVVLDGLCRLAAERQLEFEIQLGPEAVGAVDAGGLDRSLREGLLAPWRAGLK